MSPTALEISSLPAPKPICLVRPLDKTPELLQHKSSSRYTQTYQTPLVGFELTNPALAREPTDSSKGMCPGFCLSVLCLDLHGWPLQAYFLQDM